MGSSQSIYSHEQEHKLMLKQRANKGLVSPWNGSLSNMVYGADGLLSWTEDSENYVATYSGGNLATVTGGGVVKTFTYSGGQLTSVTVGAA